MLKHFKLKSFCFRDVFDRCDFRTFSDGIVCQIHWNRSGFQDLSSDLRCDLWAKKTGKDYGEVAAETADDCCEDEDEAQQPTAADH